MPTELELNSKSSSISEILCDELDEDQHRSENKPLKFLGTSEGEMKNWSALKRLGVSYSEYELGISIQVSNPADLPRSGKVERMTGFSTAQMKRSKALSVLGTNEDEVSESRSRRLGSIGRGDCEGADVDQCGQNKRKKVNGHGIDRDKALGL